MAIIWFFNWLSLILHLKPSISPIAPSSANLQFGQFPIRFFVTVSFSAVIY